MLGSAMSWLSGGEGEKKSEQELEIDELRTRANSKLLGHVKKLGERGADNYRWDGMHGFGKANYHASMDWKVVHDGKLVDGITSDKREVKIEAIVKFSAPDGKGGVRKWQERVTMERCTVNLYGKSFADAAYGMASKAWDMADSVIDTTAAVGVDTAEMGGAGLDNVKKGATKYMNRQSSYTHVSAEPRLLWKDPDTQEITRRPE
jgi:hypothetical protein